MKQQGKPSKKNDKFRTTFLHKPSPALKTKSKKLHSSKVGDLVNVTCSSMDSSIVEVLPPIENIEKLQDCVNISKLQTKRAKHGVISS